MPEQTQGAAIDVEALKKDITAQVGAAIGAALKPVTDQIGTLAAKVEPLSTLGATVAELQKGQASLAEGVKNAKGLSAEDVQKLVDAGVTKTLDARQQTEAASKKKADVRSKVLAAKGLDKLDPALVKSLPDTDDEAALGAAADGLVKVLNASGVKLADVGGAGKDGGTPPGTTPATKPFNPTLAGMTPGVAKLAESIKLPA